MRALRNSAERLRQRLVNARHVADAKCDRVAVERVVGERQVLGVGSDEFEPRALAPALRPLLADPQHVGVDVGYRHPRRRAAGARHPKRDVAGAAGDVQMSIRAMARRGDLGDQHVLPQPMQAARHQVVHQVVAAGDLVEDVVDQPLLGVQRDAAVAELCLRRVHVSSWKKPPTFIPCGLARKGRGAATFAHLYALRAAW